MSQSSNILDEINKTQNEYYETNKKKMFFSKMQKMDCAKEIVDKFDLNELIEKTIFVIPNTNKVYIDYPMFKLYANPDIYNNIIEHVIQLFSYCINYYNTFEVILNLKSFTITSAERYKDVIKFFCEECFKSDTQFVKLLDQLKIYHTPHVMEAISSLFRPFSDPIIYKKMTTYSKSESDKLLEELFR